MGLSREAAITDYGVVLTGELDVDSLSHDAATANALRASRPGPLGTSYRGPGYARLPGGAAYADVDVVGS